MNAFLVIYEFKIGGIIPAYHTEIINDEFSYGFGDEGLEINRGTNMDGQHGYKLIRSIPLGRTRKTQREIAEILLRLDNEWPAESYDLFNKNCRHFSLTLLNEMECDSSVEGRRILAGLIEFSEKIGWAISICVTGLVRSLSFSPLMLVSRPLEIFNQGRLLEWEYEFKIQMLQMLLAANGLWILYLLAIWLLSRCNNIDDEIIQQFENLEL